MPPTMVRIVPATLAFLTDLAAHNDRAWFQANKGRYESARSNMIGLMDGLIERMAKHDRLSTTSGKSSLYRIYNDTRFHKDKPPYKTWFGANLGRVKPELRGGYHFRLKPGGSFVACGFFSPEPADLRRIRVDIDQDPETWHMLLRAKRLRDSFGELQGTGVKTAPKGFAKDHPSIDLLRRKQFIFTRPLSDKEVLAPDLVERLDSTFRSIRPFFDHMSEVLTTDENGVSVLGKGR